MIIYSCARPHIPPSATVRHNMNTMSRTGERGEDHCGLAAAAGGPPTPGRVATDPEVVGLPAVVTIRIPGGRTPGEVRLYVRGAYECLIAYALEPLEVGRHVMVVTSRGSRAAEVEPTINGV